MSGIGNLIWFIFGGAFLAAFWAMIGVLFYITVIGIPFGRACFEFAKLSAFPFGKEIITQSELKGPDNTNQFIRIINLILNIFWFIIAIPMVIIYFFAGILSFITIIGIPVGIVYLRMGKFIFSPFGARVVSKKQAYASATANEIERRLKR